jgi:hypothetical protein
VTRGSIDFYRKEKQFRFDAITMGHKHNRTFTDSVVIGLSPKGRLVFKERKAIQTGSYYTNYRRGSQKHPLNYSYAESKHHSPKPWGGMFLRMRPIRETKPVNGGNCSFYRVQQDVMTEP